MELGAGEQPVEEINEGWAGGADEKGVRERLELFLLEESGWPLYGVVLAF